MPRLGMRKYAAGNRSANGRPCHGERDHTDAAANYAKSMSKAFRDAASKVLPSVVMITNTPMVAQTSGNRKSLPGDNSEEMPFGLKGTPFGDLFNNPRTASFLQRVPLACRRCRSMG